MLRALIGAEKFWDGIREYYRRYRNENVSTDEFRRVMEQASGTDLRWFFEQWLTRSGVPRVSGTWSYDPASKKVQVDVTQAQSADPYRLKLDIGIVQAAGRPPRVETVDFTGRRGTFSFDADSEPANVLLDPGTWVLMEPPQFARR